MENKRLMKLSTGFLTRSAEKRRIVQLDPAGAGKLRRASHHPVADKPSKATQARRVLTAAALVC